VHIWMCLRALILKLSRNIKFDDEKRVTRLMRRS